MLYKMATSTQRQSPRVPNVYFDISILVSYVT